MLLELEDENRARSTNKWPKKLIFKMNYGPNQIVGQSPMLIWSLLLIDIFCFVVVILNEDEKTN